MEYHDAEMLARVDDHAFILGSDPAIDAERTSIRFPVEGDAMRVDNVRIWSGKMRGDWPEKRKNLQDPAAS